MQLTPYKKLLTMAKEAVDKSLAPLRARAAQKKAELEMAKLDERIANLENQVNEACATKDIDFDRVIDRLDELALAERRRGQFQKIVKELFPDT